MCMKLTKILTAESTFLSLFYQFQNVLFVILPINKNQPSPKTDI